MPTELIIILSVAAAILLLWLIFIAAPAFCMYTMIFGKGKCRPHETTDLTGTYYEPYQEDIRREIELLKSRFTGEAHIASRDGTELCAELAERDSGKLAVILHGYHSSPTNNGYIWGNLLYENGYSLLLIHQRAHGKSKGRHSSFGILEQYDLLDWIEWLKENSKATDIVICGVSMGATTAALASDKIDDPRVRAMILDCGFNSPHEQMIYDCKRRNIPLMVLPLIRAFVKLFIKGDTRVSSLDSLSKTDIPMFFVHGTDDEAVPHECAERSFAACASPEKEFLSVKGANHTLSLTVGGTKATQQAIEFTNKFVR